MGDPTKRAMASQLLGQAYVAAHQLIEHNRDGVAKVADTLVERRELHGDEILQPPRVGQPRDPRCRSTRGRVMAEAVVPEPSREQAPRAEEPLPRFERQKAVHGGRFMIGYAVIVVMVLAALRDPRAS